MTAQEPVAWMWQHGETGNTGFIEYCSEADRAHWERMNKPRQIICPLYTCDALRAEVDVWKQGHAVHCGTIGGLRADILILRDALERIASIADLQNMQLADGFDQLRDIARAALAKLGEGA